MLEILNNVKEYGISKTAKQYKTNTTCIDFWNKKYKIYEYESQKIYPEELRLKILKEAAENGILVTARKYKSDAGLICYWNRKSGYKFWEPKQTRTSYEEKFILKVLDYAKNHGINAASEYYGVSTSTIRYWNLKYKVFAMKEVYRNNLFSKNERKNILKEVVRVGYNKVSLEYNVSINILQKWNFYLNIVPRSTNFKEENEAILKAREKEMEIKPTRIRRYKTFTINLSREKK